jgi:hypothetical protein
MTVNFAGETSAGDLLRIGNHVLGSRLILGTGKYDSFETMQQSLVAAECECVTIAVRRERLHDGSGRNILDFVDAEQYTLLPNTAGCYDAQTAVRCARMGLQIGHHQAPGPLAHQPADKRWAQPRPVDRQFDRCAPDPIDYALAAKLGG